ncbi:MAG: alkaline phosphatase family protein [Pirellulales bacterium]|nr:alkaline phosphatase family protein [Pirellulales bacterium]
MRRIFILFTIICACGLAFPQPAWAYIGPGAGFALAGSFLAVFAAIFSAMVMLLVWPVRMLWRIFWRKSPPFPPQVERVVILGLDGLDYGLTCQLLDAGKLPHLAKLRAQGSFSSLGSTLPPISPVAWSTFQTGVNPGKHNIFDFLTPDLQTYQPKLSSVEIRPAQRAWRIGPWKFGGRPDIRMLRKSKPFWSLLSEYNIFNCVIRVPITFPPEKLHGIQLSAMCVPDLRGTQGTFSHYTTNAARVAEKTGGDVRVVTRQELPGGQIRIRDVLLGPPHPTQPTRGPLTAPFEVFLPGDGTATLKINGATYHLRPNEYTPWVQVRFSLGWGRGVTGICRFMLLNTTPEFDLYATPINIDPENPVLPLGYPAVYPIYLAKNQGPYATLGLAEDTWGLSEEVLDDAQFARQCQDIDRERESMFFDGLDKVRRGFCVCVFDGTDRMQHMFWRYQDPDHPARPAEFPPEHTQAITELYQRMDALVGRTMERCRDPGTLLMVLSDHGFNTFRRGIDLNRWLEEQGYLVVRPEERNQQYLGGVDWSRTRAFAIGLTGIFINEAGKFAQGIVPAGETAAALRAEIAAKLAKLIDPQTGQPPIKKVYQSPLAYRGPYKEQAPDLIVGYERGYRVSWDAAVGKTSTSLFHDNLKAWSGDHCVDPSVVPGILFCNRAITTENPRLLDIAPTVLNLFGIPQPDYMDGKILSLGKPSPVTKSQSTPSQGTVPNSPVRA